MAGIKKNKKSGQRKVSLVFDEQKRREFLTGFHKRKLQRKKQAKENFDRELKEERKRIKREAKDAYKKLVVSHRPVPELEKLLSEEYEDDAVTVTVTELSTSDIARKNNWIGPNQPKYSAENLSSESEENDEEAAEIPGMELTVRKAPKKTEKAPKVTFNSEKEIKRALKKQATKVVKKSKVFKMKYKMDKQKERKKSFQEKKQRLKISSSSHKKDKRKR